MTILDDIRAAEADYEAGRAVWLKGREARLARALKAAMELADAVERYQRDECGDPTVTLALAAFRKATK